MNTKNAQIESVFLGREDHGILTFYITIKFAGCGCCVGGFALDSYDRETKQRIYSSAGLGAIAKILDVVGVKSWEELPGKYIRIEDVRLGETINKIGNIIEDKWFNFREHFEENQFMSKFIKVSSNEYVNTDKIVSFHKSKTLPYGRTKYVYLIVYYADGKEYSISFEKEKDRDDCFNDFVAG